MRNLAAELTELLAAFDRLHAHDGPLSACAYLVQLPPVWAVVGKKLARRLVKNQPTLLTQAEYQDLLDSVAREVQREEVVDGWAQGVGALNARLQKRDMHPYVGDSLGDPVLDVTLQVLDKLASKLNQRKDAHGLPAN